MSHAQHNDPSYQRFVEDMARECHCREDDRPCDGLLAGGLCDSHGKSPGEDCDWRDRGDQDEERDEEDFRL